MSRALAIRAGSGPAAGRGDASSGDSKRHSGGLGVARVSVVDSVHAGPTAVATRRGIAVSLGAALSVSGTGDGWWGQGSHALAASCPEGTFDNLGICMNIPDASAPAESQSGSDDESLGKLITLSSGVQYRELLEGTGPAAEAGSVCAIRYQVFRLSSGAYFKYSSGGKPVYLFSLGYGQELRDDLDKVFRFTLGSPGELPSAVPPVILGMRQGGIRRVLIPPFRGWAGGAKPKLQPDDFGSRRRLENHKDEPLLMELELVRVYAPGEAPGGKAVRAGVLELPEGAPYRLPGPPSLDPVPRRVS